MPLACDEIELTFLGTGTSHGVPMIACDCAVCRSDDPRDRRNRASVAIRTPDRRVILIDTAPELRLSAVARGIERADAILFTHAHADHIMGLDDVRRFNDVLGGALTCYGTPETLRRLRDVFDYAMKPFPAAGADRPSLVLEPIDAASEICGVRVIPVPLRHGNAEILGFRIGQLAYCTDCSAIPAGSWDLLAGLDLLVLGALRHRPHPAHFNLAEALDVIRRLRPRRALLTHVTHELPHAATNAGLPTGVNLAYDGLAVRAPLGKNLHPLP